MKHLSYPKITEEAVARQPWQFLDAADLLGTYLWLESWICNRNYIFHSSIVAAVSLVSVPSPWNSCLLHYQTYSKVLLTALFFIFPVPVSLWSHSRMYQETDYCCYVRHCKTFWSPLCSTGQSGETWLAVASVRGKTPFLAVMLFVWIVSICFLSEASHKKLIPLSSTWIGTKHIGFVLCNHKCFETCLTETLYLLFCRDFSNRNQQRQSWLKVGILFSLHFGNYFVQKGWDLLAVRKWNHE